MSMLDNYRPEDITPAMRKYFGVEEAKDAGTSEGAKKGWKHRNGGLGNSQELHSQRENAMNAATKKYTEAEGKNYGLPSERDQHRAEKSFLREKMVKANRDYNADPITQAKAQEYANSPRGKSELGYLASTRFDDER